MATNTMLMPLQIERQYGASLDADYTFETLEELKNYATTSALAYPGQMLYCKETDSIYKVNADKTDITGIGAGGDLSAYQLSDDITEYSEEEIRELLELSEEELLELTSLLSDTEVRIDRTWSSSKIYQDLQQILDDAKEYTLAELAKGCGASYKVVTDVDSMIDSKVLYLMKDATSGTYGIYVYDEDAATAELIGDFEVNLDDYYTKTECDDAFVLKTAFELLNGNIGDVTALNTTSKVIVDAINEVKNSVENSRVELTQAEYDALGDTVLTDNVVYYIEDGTSDEVTLITEINNTAKNTEIPTAKAVYDKINDSNSTLNSEIYYQKDEVIDLNSWHFFFGFTTGTRFYIVVPLSKKLTRSCTFDITTMEIAHSNGVIKYNTDEMLSVLTVSSAPKAGNLYLTVDTTLTHDNITSGSCITGQVRGTLTVN